MSVTAATMPASSTGTRLFRQTWYVRELVMIGVFSAAAKLTSLLVALLGGGPNPLTLLAKNCIFTTLLIVLMFKIRKPGTLTLFMIVTVLVNILLTGTTVTLAVPMIVCGLVCEAIILVCGGMERSWAPYVGVALYDISTKVAQLGISYLTTRENPSMLYIVGIFVVIGYLGSIIGLFTGYRAVKELRHAGIIAH